ncbi:MAG: GGDEF domain-containing protein [Lachnospiraceae bacterium]|nr:GGDEF domain-containing protein [Lachnospiraceae bacterium]
MEHRIVALVSAAPQRDRNREIIRRLTVELKERQMKLLVFGTLSDLAGRDTNDYGEKSVFRLIPYKKLAGLIIQAGSFLDPDEAAWIISEAKAAGVPVMDLDHETTGIPSVCFDYDSAFAEMVRHVILYHGCRKIAMIAGAKGQDASAEREKTFYRICGENSIPEENIRICYGELWDWPAREAVIRMIEEKDVPEAFICMNDAMALGCIGALQEKGYSVPGDVIVTGMDGIMLAEYSEPRLTTVPADITQLCREAAEQIDTLSRGRRDEARKIRIQMKADYEGSCGCAGRSDVNAGMKLLEIDSLMSLHGNHERDMARMRHKLMDEDRYQMFEKMALYMESDSWICCNPSFWERQDAGGRRSFDYRRREPLFDQEMISARLSPSGAPEERFEETMFSREELLPGLEGLLRSRDMLLFCPLNFQQEVIGYCVFDGIGQVQKPFLFSQLCRNISMILKVVRDREQAEYVTRVLESSNRVLYDLSMHDELTGLDNRRGLMQRLEEICTTKAESGRVLSYTYLDLDSFKDINDKWGHDEGDRVLKLVADALKNVSDTYADVSVSRVGGDEFVVFGTLKDVAEGERLLAALKAEIIQLNHSMGKDYSIRCSLGQSNSENISREVARELIRKADDAMYRCKRAGKLSRREN